MKAAVKNIGPWPLGQDTVSAPTAAVFQHPERDGPLPRLRRAFNVDLDAEGRAFRRDGTTSKIAGSALKRGFYGGGVLLLQDGGTIYTVTPGEAYSATALVPGLNPDNAVEFHQWDADTVFWTNGETGGTIYQGAAYPLGLAAPPAPTLTTEAGSLPAGSYRVVVTLEDALGREHGASRVSEVVTNGSEDIVVSLSSVDPGAVYANIYSVLGPNQEDLLWCARVAVGSLPAVISDTRVSRRPCRTQALRGPIAGDGISEANGYLLTWRDNVVFRSRGQTPHLFHPRELMTFEHNVRGVAAPDSSGFYVATDGGLFWVATGANAPKDWRPDRINRKCYAKGHTVDSTERVNVADRAVGVALFADTDGLVAGLPNADVRYPTRNRMRLDTTNATVRFAYRERSEGKHQLLMGIT